MAEKREEFSGTTIKETRTKPSRHGIWGGTWEWLVWGGEVGGKGRQLYLNSNKISKNGKKKF